MRRIVTQTFRIQVSKIELLGLLGAPPDGSIQVPIDDEGTMCEIHDDWIHVTWNKDETLDDTNSVPVTREAPRDEFDLEEENERPCPVPKREPGPKAQVSRINGGRQ